MKVICELTDYEIQIEETGNEPVIVADVWDNNDMVRITVGKKTVKVSAEELMRAVRACSR